MKKHIFVKLYFIINIVSLLLFSMIMLAIINNSSIIKLDESLSSKVALLYNPLLTKIIMFIADISNATSLFIFSMILCYLYLYQNKFRDVILLISSILGAMFLVFLIKSIVHRLRPENALLNISGYSFPSGHSAIAIILFLLLLPFKDSIKNAVLKNIFITANILIFMFIILSRIYLNIHWFSDIIAGFTLGLFWFTLLKIILNTFSVSKI